MQEDTESDTSAGNARGSSERKLGHILSRESLSGRVSRELTIQILRGDLEPGDLLPSEEHLAQNFGVSRPVLREAVKRLSGVGLVVSRQGRQSRVAPYEEWNEFAPDLLLARREAGAVEDVLVELLELRRIIEIEGAALAAARATPDDLTLMRTRLMEVDAALHDPTSFVRADIEFHNAILAATKNHLVTRLFAVVRPLIEFGREISVAIRPGGVTASQAEHWAIFEAIERGAVDGARESMEVHLRWSKHLEFRDGVATTRVDSGQGRPLETTAKAALTHSKEPKLST